MPNTTGEATGRGSRGALGLGLLTTMIVLSADQLSKYWILYGFHLPDKGSVPILPGLNFTMVWNTAVTFGMFSRAGSSGRIIFSAVALLIVGGLLVWMARSRRPLITCAVGAIAGGAIGNVIDRLRYGAVVDFIHLHAAGWSWYVFNVADSAIVCSVAALIVDGLLQDGRKTG
ncbi:signal peptidase II [Acetobacter sacchari]|uniref:Lipoprotein signal peptidase n=1 Tax=Acetobacter sacchari TaxID=2661687 RepID=A0ABS3LWS2_9PROT|nr:signal peptidase II [Acetobacter sacchari]MBO1360359.1 signal peptidase II [Acetobacter sacchari]